MTDVRPTARTHRVKVTAVAALVAAGVWGWWHFQGRPAARIAKLMAEAREARAGGDPEAAKQISLAVLQRYPDADEAALLAAECAAEQQHDQQALALLHRISSDDVKVAARVALLKAHLQRRLHQFDAAEVAYLEAVELAPDNVDANLGLARLLGLCARRDDAVPFILRTIQLGAATDLLVLLSRENGVINDLEALDRAHAAAPDDANPLIGLAWHAAESGRVDESIGLLREAIGHHPDLAAAHIALGRQFLAANRFDELIRWSEQLPAGADDFAATWLLRGRMAENDGSQQAAIRCYWEAARRAPELKTANVRLARLLAETGDDAGAERFAEHVRRIQTLQATLDRVLFSDAHGSSGPLLQLAASYEQAGRFWEAYGWCQMAVQANVFDRNSLQFERELKSRAKGVPLRLTMDDANVAAALDLTSYPLPQFERVVSASSVDAPSPSSSLSFRDDAEAAGLRFRYFNGTKGEPTRKMFEFTGGGVGVIDFDRDGYPDVWLTQGTAWPPGTSTGVDSDRLHRNAFGAAFTDVTDDAAVREDDFGQGIAVGDFDADGFPDVYVSNIGSNRLWKNNGDGTFSDVTDIAGVAGDGDWSTSCLLADLNGDTLPDVYSVNYMTAEDVFERVCRHDDGAPRACSPFHFDGQPDRVWLNSGDGRFVDAVSSMLSVNPNGKGLGIAAWDADGSGRLSVFVANDTTPNFFFVPESKDDGVLRFRERGISAGLGTNIDGKAEGCMGIAVGDADGDGRTDLHVTNFYSESNTLYLNASDGYYEDRTGPVGLHTPTFDLLGFGTQFLDVDLDGRLELFVANGHVDDLRSIGRPYAMPPQLFRWDGRSMISVDSSQLGTYFEQHWIGRAAANVDWNRDGRPDLIVGHLHADTSLLTNTTPVDRRFLSLRLCGVTSNRDAVGTTVQVRIGERTLVRQLTAGDGYQSGSERRLLFGLGDDPQAIEVIVNWPGGTVQRFDFVEQVDQIPESQEFTLVEGRTMLTVP